MRSGAEASRTALGGGGSAGRSQSPWRTQQPSFWEVPPGLPCGVLAGARAVERTPGPSAGHWLWHQHVSQPSQQAAAPAAPDVGPASRPSCCSCWQRLRPSSPWSPSLDSRHAHQVGWPRGDGSDLLGGLGSPALPGFCKCFLHDSLGCKHRHAQYTSLSLCLHIYDASY